MKQKGFVQFIPLVIGGLVIFGALFAGFYIKNQPQQFGATTLAPFQGGTGTSTTPTYGKMLVGNVGGTYSVVATSTLGITATEVYTGTVTSVAMTVPTGLSVSGSPITTAGTLALSLTSGYVIPLTASTTEWATAYGWGDWSGQGFLTTAGFGTPFYTYFHATTTDYLSQGSTNFYASQTRFDNLLSATSSVSGITALPNLSITKSQVSDFGTYESVLTFNYPLSRATNAISIVATSSMAINTDNLVQGSTNLFNQTHTGDVSGATTLTIGASKVLDTMINFGTGATQVNTADVSELTNLYYTDARVNTLLNASSSIPNLATSPISITTKNISISTAGTWSGLAGTATALASDPTDCGSNTWATTIAASGNLTCSAITYAGITAMTSANFAGLISDETGSGLVVLATSPTLTTPVLGYASSTQIDSTGSAYFATTAGNVGIGTTTPGYRLTVNSTDGTTNLFQVATTTNQGIFVINSSGNVGIGTTGPNNKLEVNGNIGIGAIPATAGAIRLPTTNSIQYRNSANSQDLNLISWSAGNVLTLGDASTGDINFTTAGSGNDFIFNTGNVGIGTTGPGEKLTVVAADNSSGTDVARFLMNNLSDSLSIWYGGIRRLSNSATADLYIDSKGTGKILLQTYGGTGNVGIGTTTPGMKFAVQGDALADSWNVYSDIYKGDALTQLKGIKAKTGETGDWVSVDHNSLPVGILKNNPIKYDEIIPATETTATSTKHISYTLQTLSISGLTMMNTQAILQLEQKISSLKLGSIGSAGEFIFDKEKLKQEIKAELKAELKKEILAELIAEIKNWSFTEKLKLLFGL